MGHFLALAVSFPAVVYTVLLGVALVYWIFVVIGAAQLDVLGDGAADAAIEGAAKGALEGATKGVLEGALEGAADPLEAGDVAGGNAGIVAALKLRSAPATVVLSALLLFAWIFAMLAARVAGAFVTEGLGLTLLKVAIFVLAPVLALLPTSLAVRPLARVFTPPKATTHDALVGKTCTIRTGTVTERFGEATLDDGGAAVVVRVRVDGGEKLGRGDPAIIVGYDPDRQEFTVARLDDGLGASDGRGRQARR